MKRQYVILIFALFSLLGSVTAALATAQQRDFELRGYVNPTQDSNLPFRLPLLGVNADLTQYTGDALRQHLQWMRDANITWVRQSVDWSLIEPQQGDFAWTVWDKIVAEIAEFPDLHLVVVLLNTPAWARTPTATEHPTAPPADPADFAQFASAFAARYAMQIDYYQIWDEQNLDDGWGLLEPRPADYFALLQAGYAAIHSVDPGATVILGGLAPTTEQGPLNLSDIRYLQDLYALGARDYMDAVAAKPYGFNTSPVDDRHVEPAILNFSRMVALREIMVANGDGQKALWADEWGWNHLPTDWSGSPSIWGAVSAEQQVAFTLSALDRAQREWTWLGGMILHQWQPNAPRNDPQWGFALLKPDDQFTPLYNALAARPIPTQAVDGIYPAANRFAEYSGVWTFSELGADIGWLNDSQLRFRFAGVDVALLVREDDYVAYLYVNINAQPANALPRDNRGNAYLLLTSATQSPETNLIVVARNLPLQPHSLTAIADRGWDRWALVGYAVSSGDLTAPYNQQIGVAWFTVFISFAAVVISVRQINRAVVWKTGLHFIRQIETAGQLALSAVTSLALLIGMLLTWHDATPNILRRDEIQLGLALATAGLIYIEPGFIITILAALLLFVLIYHRVDLGLMLTLFWSPFFLFPVELLRFALPMSEMMLLITAAAWILRSLAELGRERQSTVTNFRAYPLGLQLLRLQPLDWGMIAWVLLGTLSLLWTAEAAPAITELRTMILEPALFYAVFRTSIRSRAEIIRLVDGLLAAGLVVVLIGFILYVAGDAIGGNRGVIEAEGGARRLASVYGSPNNVALFLGRCIPFALAMALAQIDQLRKRTALFLFVSMLITVILTLSAGALFLGVPFAIASVLVLHLGKKAWRTLIALAAAALAALLMALQFERFARLLDFSAGTNFFRLRVWESSINILRDYPITGLGLDQFLYAFRSTYILPDAEAEPTLSHPHNFILDFWIRLSIFGMLLFLWLQYHFWTSAAQHLKHLRLNLHDPLLLAIQMGSMGSMINLLAHGLIDNSVFVNDLCYVFALLLALNAAASNTRAIDEPQ